jgi:beta-phosphoglucomutase family hydrolase
VLGLPDRVSACLFDMDGVVTRTATVHDAAWKEMFDEFLRERAAAQGGQFVPFDPVRDYDDYVDGKPRLDGIRAFLESRGIELPLGTPDDLPGTPTIWGLGNRKNALFLQVLERDGVEVYDGSRRYLTAVRAAGLRTALVSSSANTAKVLAIGGVADMFDATVDGHVAEAEGLRGKPAPDTYQAAAAMLGVEPGSAAVFEDALAGVEAGRAGGFGIVVGVDRVGQAAQLREHGADIVVADLADLMPDAGRDMGPGEGSQRQ